LFNQPTFLKIIPGSAAVQQRPQKLLSRILYSPNVLPVAQQTVSKYLSIISRVVKTARFFNQLTVRKKAG